MEKNKWISDKIRKLEHENKGRSHAQNIAIAFSMYENRQQGGYSDPTKVFIEKSAAQLPIKNINYNVETTGIKEGNLQPGYYTRVDYNNGKSDYLRPEGLDELRKMNNYRLYMEAQAKKQQPQMQMGEAIAMPSYQFGGFSFPNLMNNFQPVPDLQSQMQPTQTVVNQPFAKPELPQGVDVDLSGLPTQTPNYERNLSTDMAMVGDTSTMDTQTRDDRRLVNQYKYDQNQGYWGGDKTNDINRIQLANPYGGVSLENALYFGARGFGEGNAWKGALGSLTAGLKAARIGMSGYAAGKEQNRVQDYMRNQLYKPNTNYNYGQVGQNATYLFQEGGKVPTNAEMLTGAFITDQPNPNVKIEDAEFVKNSQTGQIQKAVGDKHEAKSGGIPVNLPPQSKILSDYTKIGAKNAKELKEKYDITLKASDTFAKAMDKVNKKIGITELIQEEKEYSEKFEKQMKSSIDKKTKDVNLNFLAKELEEIEKEKLQLQPIQDQAFEEIFRLQEMIPKKSDGKTLLKQEGGYAPNVIEYSKKYGITPQRVMELMQDGGFSQSEQMPEQQGQEEQLMQAVVQMLEQGATPEEVMQQLLEMGVPEEMGAQMIQSVMQPEQMREGGEMIKRADGSYSRKGLWDNIRANRGSGKEPTKEMLEQEEKIAQEGGTIPERYKKMGFSKVGVKKESTRPGKKWMVLAKKGDKFKVVHGGAKGMQDYSQHGSEERKKRFWDRMGGKDSAKANDPFSPLFWHKKLGKWEEGGEIPEEDFMDDEIVMQVAQALEQGADPNEVMQQLVQSGISEEEAMDIIEEATSNEQGDPNQIIEAFSQLTQQDPQQIVAQLQEMQPEEQQQVLQQMVATLQQEQPQQMMREGGYSLPMAQEGKLTYEQIVARNNAAGTNLNTPSIWTGQTATNFYTPYTNWENYLGRTPRDINSQETYQKGISSDLTPQLSKLLETGEMPLTNKHRDLLKKAGVKNADKIVDYTTLTEADKKKLGKDFILSGYVDTLAGHRGVAVLPGEMSQEEYAKSKGAYDKLTDKEGRQIYAKYDDKGNILKDDKGNFVFYYPKKAGEPEKKVEPSKVTEEVKKTVETQQQTPQVNNRMVNKTMMANLPVNFNLPPSSLQGVYKPEVNLSRMDPYKLSAEPYLANIESQRQAATENNYNLPDVQRAAYNANMLAASQMAANDAIGKVAQANTAAQFQTDMYNAQQADKEQLTNLGLAQQYENKMYGAINATDTDLRKYFAQNNAENKQRFMDIANLNMINAVTPNYQSTGSDVIFNNAPLNFNVSQADSEAMQNFLATEKDPAKRAAYINNYVKSVRSS